ncbi:T9SS type A sorting domain-containing protein, partial [bacterium]|nr:T9SS type A sorting domain-containing protein [bacterium]
YPNPFNPTVSIPFALPQQSEVLIAIYNLLGQEVFRESRSFEAGNHRFHFDANSSQSELVSGLYLIQMETEGNRYTRKMMLLK